MRPNDITKQLLIICIYVMSIITFEQGVSYVDQPRPLSPDVNKPRPLSPGVSQPRPLSPDVQISLTPKVVTKPSLPPHSPVKVYFILTS